MNKGYKHSYVDVDSVKAHYIEAGQGDPTLVLVHGGGAGSCSEANYGDVVGLLGEYFHTVAVDIIGYGYTAPRGPQDYWGQAQGDFLVRFLDVLNTKSVFLAGNSYGGFTVSYASYERPGLVKRLILINSLGGTFPILPTPEGRTYFSGPAGVKSEKPTMEKVREQMEGFLYAHKDLVTDERVKKGYEVAMHNYEYAAKRDEVVGASIEAANKNRSYKGRHIADWAGELKIPVLLTWSEPGAKLEWGLSYLKKNPGSEMHIFPWSGHHLQTDQRDRWVQVVVNWLKNEPARPAN